MNRFPSADTPPGGPESWEALARYVAGESTPEEASRIHAWLSADPGRAQLVDTLNASFHRLSADPAVAAAVDVEAALQRVKARFDEPKVYELPVTKSIPQEQSSRRWRRTLVRVAAVLVIALGVSLIWRVSQDRETPLVATASYVTGVGQTDSLRLPDGTRVVLGPLSRLALAASYGNGSRLVELNGEALFDVEHDASRPFSVRAGEATIRDLGTRFSVHGHNGERVRVAVTAGAVVLHATHASERSGVILNAGDRGVLDERGKVAAERGSVTEDDVAFTDGRLVFENAPLSEVSVELRRWYGIELNVAEPALASRRLTAAFQHETPGQVLDVIGLALGARIERKGDTAFVRIPR